MLESVRPHTSQELKLFLAKSVEQCVTFISRHSFQVIATFLFEKFIAILQRLCILACEINWLLAYSCYGGVSYVTEQLK
jgi:hypothetical protein